MFFDGRKRAEALRAAIAPICARAELSACAGVHADAARDYAEAWALLAGNKEVKSVGADYAFWVLMNCVNSEWLSGNYEGAMEAAAAAHRNLRGKSFGPVGNPIFHLRVGQSLWTRAEVEGESPADAAVDDLARALICGGVEMYSGEDPKFLDAVTRVLDPPVGFETWQASRGYAGSCRDLMDGAVGHVALVLTEKLGKSPPYGDEPR
jgi:hypothetical protein